MTNEIVNKETGEVLADPHMSRWMVMREQADVLIKSGFLPPAVNTPEKAIAIMMKGKELGIGAMEALNSINVIQGKTSVSPQLMLALARRTGELENLDIKKDDKEATVTVKRKGMDPITTHFGVKEATAMGMMFKDNYKKQPAIMFQWRALAENLRLTFGDAISGMYTPDELGAETNEDGFVTSRPVIAMPKAIEHSHSIPAEVVTDKENV
jgi:hypothetical protein